MPRITEEERKRFHQYLDECIDKMNRPKNAKKQHWSGQRITTLHAMTVVEIAELQVALLEASPVGLAEECMDIVNMTMMIMDNVHGDGWPE